MNHSSVLLNFKPHPNLILCSIPSINAVVSHTYSFVPSLIKNFTAWFMSLPWNETTWFGFWIVQRYKASKRGSEREKSIRGEMRKKLMWEPWLKYKITEKKKQNKTKPRTIAIWALAKSEQTTSKHELMQHVIQALRMYCPLICCWFTFQLGQKPTVGQSSHSYLCYNWEWRLQWVRWKSS